MSSPLLSRLAREPLMHFLVLGALVFAADQVVASREADPHVITISRDVDTELTAIFQAVEKRPPNKDELQTLRQRWIDNEVLYREGLALRVDQGDPTIRERVIFKSLNIMQANLTLPKVTEAELRNWFEKHRDKYDEPPRVDFMEAVLIGDRSPAAIERFVNALNTGQHGQTPGDLRIFKGRPRQTIVQSYGAAFSQELEQLPEGRWAVLTATDGPHIVRRDGTSAGQAAHFEDRRDAILQDWKDQTMQALRTSAVRDLGKKYRVQIAQGAAS